MWQAENYKEAIFYDTRLYKKENDPTDIFFNVYAEKPSYLRYRYINKKRKQGRTQKCQNWYGDYFIYAENCAKKKNLWEKVNKKKRKEKEPVYLMTIFSIWNLNPLLFN